LLTAVKRSVRVRTAALRSLRVRAAWTTRRGVIDPARLSRVLHSAAGQARLERRHHRPYLLR